MCVIAVVKISPPCESLDHPTDEDPEHMASVCPVHPEGEIYLSFRLFADKWLLFVSHAETDMIVLYSEEYVPVFGLRRD